MQHSITKILHLRWCWKWQVILFQRCGAYLQRRSGWVGVEFFFVSSLFCLQHLGVHTNPSKKKHLCPPVCVHMDFCYHSFCYYLFCFNAFWNLDFLQFGLWTFYSIWFLCPIWSIFIWLLFYCVLCFSWFIYLLILSFNILLYLFFNPIWSLFFWLLYSSFFLI
jgi:hypothetical protein